MNCLTHDNMKRSRMSLNVALSKRLKAQNNSLLCRLDMPYSHAAARILLKICWLEQA